MGTTRTGDIVSHACDRIESLGDSYWTEEALPLGSCRLVPLPVLLCLLPDFAGGDPPGGPRVEVPLLEVDATITA
jgi:hypothetical protein